MVFVKIRPGYQMNGKGMFLGSHKSNKYYFWRGRGKVDVPFELAAKLIYENPRKVDFVDDSLMKKFMNSIPIKETIVRKKVFVDFDKLDKISGFGPEVMEDVKSLFYLVSNIHSTKDFIEYIENNGHISLNNNIAKKLRVWLKGEFADE